MNRKYIVLLSCMVFLTPAFAAPKSLTDVETTDLLADKQHRLSMCEKKLAGARSEIVQLKEEVAKLRNDLDNLALFCAVKLLTDKERAELFKPQSEEVPM